MRAQIIGMGFYVPEKILTNYDLEKMVETTNDWIIERTGIKTRHIADENTYCSDMGYYAAKQALENANIAPEELELIITATVSADSLLPTAACIIQKKLGAVNAAAVDVSAACSGFIYALSMADAYIKSGIYKKVLVVASENLSRITDWKDRNTCILFGDGAGAAVLTPSEGEAGIIQTHLGADGNMGHAITLLSHKKPQEELDKRVSGIPNTLWMDGSEVFKFAVRIMVGAINKVLEQAGMSLEDIDLIVPHQANVRIIDGAIKRLKVAPEKVMCNIEDYGNMSGASIPVAICEALKTGRIKSGDNILMVGFGGGLTWASTIIKWK